MSLQQAEMQELLEASAMIKKKYEFMVLTPLMLHGANNKVDAETRETSLKGVLRYWWRALQFGDESYSSLLAKESKLFGGVGKGNTMKSKVLLKFHPVKQTNKESICPHKTKGGSAPAIKQGTRLSLEISCYKKDEIVFNEIEQFVLLLGLISGLGQRSRRGAGAIQDTSIEWADVNAYKNHLLTQLETIVPGKIIVSQHKHHILKTKEINNSHPNLLNVWIGKAFDSASEARYEISEAGHVANPGNQIQYLGKMKPRQASPLHVTVRKICGRYYPVISEVHVYKKTQEDGYQEAKKKFLAKLGVSM